MGAPLASETERLGHKNQVGGGPQGSARGAAQMRVLIALMSVLRRSIALRPCWWNHNTLPRCEFGAKRSVL